MPKFNYRKVQKTANRLIKNFGQDVVITHTEQGEHDPTTGLSSETITTQEVRAVLLDYGSTEIDGTIITIMDKKLLVSAKKTNGEQLTKPHINDTVVVDSVNYTIKTPLGEIKPNGTVSVLFKLNVRA